MSRSSTSSFKPGIGVDIVAVSRFISVASNTKFISKVFTKKEAAYCRSKANAAERFAARFAGKEAVLKAFSAYNQRPQLRDIEILPGKAGPEAKVQGMRGFSIYLSLSHERQFAVAFALVARNR